MGSNECDCYICSVPYLRLLKMCHLVTFPCNLHDSLGLALYTLNSTCDDPFDKIVSTFNTRKQPKYKMLFGINRLNQHGIEFKVHKRRT